MNPFLALLRKKVPKSGKDMPRYYRDALGTTEIVLAIYFLLTTLLFSWVNHRPEWVPV